MPENTWLAIILVIGLVVVVNLGLWFMWRGRGMHDQIDTLRRASRSIRQPWKREDDSLKELSERVKQLRPSEEDKETKAGKN